MIMENKTSHNRFYKLLERASGFSPRHVFIANIIILLLIASFDYLTGEDVSLAILYFVPVSISVRCLGRVTLGCRRQRTVGLFPTMLGLSVYRRPTPAGTFGQCPDKPLRRPTIWLLGRSRLYRRNRSAPVRRANLFISRSGRWLTARSIGWGCRRVWFVPATHLSSIPAL